VLMVSDQRSRGLDAPAFAVGPPNCNGVTRLRITSHRTWRLEAWQRRDHARQTSAGPARSPASTTAPRPSVA